MRKKKKAAGPWGAICTDSEAKRKQFIAAAQHEILHLKRPAGSIIHNFLPPQQQPSGVIVAFINAAGHVELQAAVAQVSVAECKSKRVL